MPQTLSNILVHIVFSTKNRTEFLHQELRMSLYPYIGGIAREMRCPILSIGGVKDHVHLLIRAQHSISVSEIVRVIKTNSSRWIHETQHQGMFGWQEGYGAFSVSQSNVATVAKYIANQEQHHAKKSFKEEFIEFLKQNDIEY